MTEVCVEFVEPDMALNGVNKGGRDSKYIGEWCEEVRSAFTEKGAR